MHAFTIVSGGQSGADRAALDCARAHGIAIGGWIPLGRESEDGPLPSCYLGMREAHSRVPAVRTRLNVRDADATVVFRQGPPSGGTELTLSLAQASGKPLADLDLGALTCEEASRRLSAWLAAHSPRTLNVAGPRRSEAASIYAAVYAVLDATFLDQQQHLQSAKD